MTTQDGAEATDKNVKGRPTSYKEEYAELAYKFCLLGADDKDLARNFDVCEKTINNWKKEQPLFLQSIKNGKEVADAEIAHSLYHRAKGYTHPEDKIFNDNGTPMIVPTVKHYPPDTTAAIFWLKNRRPEDWRDKVDHDHTSKGESLNQPRKILFEDMTK
jgi:hypothetical protein